MALESVPRITSGASTRIVPLVGRALRAASALRHRPARLPHQSEEFPEEQAEFLGVSRLFRFFIHAVGATPTFRPRPDLPPVKTQFVP